MLANGAASPSASTPPISPDSEDYAAMSSILTSFSQTLSQLVVRDGEGATKFVTISVRNALLRDRRTRHSEQHRTLSAGEDSTVRQGRELGRILCAIGYTSPSLLSSPADCVLPAKTNVLVSPGGELQVQGRGSLKLLVDGEPQAVDEDRAARLLEDEDLIVDVDLGLWGRRRGRIGRVISVMSMLLLMGIIGRSEGG